MKMADIGVPRDEIQRRLTGLREGLVAEGLDAALLVHAVDVYYFSGTRQNSVLWVTADGREALLVKKSVSRAVQESMIGDVRLFPASKDLPQLFGTDARRIGMTFDVLPVQHYFFYRNLLPDRELADISPMNRELRSVKSAWELEQMRMSGRLLSEAFREIPGLLRPSMREVDLAAEFEFRLRKAGIGGFLRIRGFNQEIAGLAVSGESAAAAGCFDGPVTGAGLWRAAPFGPSTDRISEGVPVVVDYGGFYNGYIVDMTRIFCCGGIDPEMEHAFRVSLDIQTWISRQLCPGKIPEDIYQGALRMAAEAGLDDFFMGRTGEQARFVGHGVGLELDELPVLAPRFRTPLREGQTIAVEPKFLFPAKGAVGIENTFAVGSGGGERLTDLADDLIVL